jgi:prepilin-type N-terminal cleavage/methylation domain-containing protein
MTWNKANRIGCVPVQPATARVPLRNRQAGFTLLEVLVVLGVLGLILGAAMPLASAAVEVNRRDATRGALAAVGAALDSYFAQHAAFPVSLDAADFLGVHLHAGDGLSGITDPFGGGLNLVYLPTPATLSATVYSRGENNRDDGPLLEEHRVLIQGAVPGTRRTWQKLRIIVEVLANHLETGGSIAGDWVTVCNACGLGATYHRDGFGSLFHWDAATHTLRSAGPDRVVGTADDLRL